MTLQSLGYVGVGASDLGDWSHFATDWLGMQMLDESATCRAFVGTFQTQMKSWAAAEESYRAAIKLDPDYTLAWGYLGIPLYYEGKAAEAVEACKKSIALQRDNFGAWSNLGGIYLMQGDLTAASALIDELKDFHARAAYKVADRLSAALDKATAAKEAAK